MAITIVDSGSVGEGGGGNIVVNFTAEEDDVVFVAYALGGTTDFAMSETGATWIEAYNLYADGTVDDNQAGYFKVMGESPDSSVTLAGTGSAGQEAAAIFYVLRGVDTSTPLDVAVQTNVQPSGGQPNPPSITTATDGALVVATASIGRGDITPTVPTNYDNLVYFAQGTGADVTMMAATRTLTTAGADDPDGFGFPFQSNRATCAATIAFRPAAGGGGPAGKHRPRMLMGVG